MEQRRFWLRLRTLAIFISISLSPHSTPCDARTSMQILEHYSHSTDTLKRLKLLSNKKIYPSNNEFEGVNSPFSLVPYGSLPPLSSPNTPPLFAFPPMLMPSPPSYGYPSPVQSPPPPPPPPGPGSIPTPASSPPKHVPPPPVLVPSPPHLGPSPPKHVPSPPVYLPPVIYPPPQGLPPPHREPEHAVWCVAKPTVPDPIIQEAMDYACGFGGDCESIKPNGPCFQPNTLIAHASYAFNSYWQRTKVAGATCNFGGTAMIVTADPSFGECHYIYS